MVSSVLNVKVIQSCLTLCDPMDYTAHGILQARILEWGRLFLLQGIFPTQGSNPGLPNCRRILYQLSPKGRPSVLNQRGKTIKLFHLQTDIFMILKTNERRLPLAMTPPASSRPATTTIRAPNRPACLPPILLQPPLHRQAQGFKSKLMAPQTWQYFLSSKPYSFPSHDFPQWQMDISFVQHLPPPP